MKLKKQKNEALTYTVEEAAKLLGISRASAYVAASRKEIPSLRFGKRIVVPKAKLDRMLDSKPMENRV
jgi:excisionase family DNA binding protein